MKLNINAKIRFRLTDHGKARWQKLPVCIRQVDDGLYETELFHFAHVFGPNMFVGAKPEIDTEIILTNSTLWPLLGDDDKPIRDPAWDTTGDPNLVERSSNATDFGSVIQGKHRDPGKRRFW